MDMDRLCKKESLKNLYKSKRNKIEMNIKNISVN